MLSTQSCVSVVGCCVVLGTPGLLFLWVDKQARTTERVPHDNLSRELSVSPVTGSDTLLVCARLLMAQHANQDVS